MPEPRTLSCAAIGLALRHGVRDFLSAPQFGLFFSAIYVAGGWVLYGAASASGREWWLVPVILGFPLFGPFAAIGLYEVSRRLQSGLRLSWSDILRVVFAQKDRQLPSMAAVILMLFLFWVFVGHTMFALFLGLSPASSTAGVNPLGLFLAGNGPWLLMIGTMVGAGFAGVLFGMSVVGLPVLLERDIDFISAIILSFSACILNFWPMLLWGLMITVLIALAMAPLFLGFFLVLPVLGHASWHMYGQMVGAEDNAAAA